MQIEPVASESFEFCSIITERFTFVYETSTPEDAESKMLINVRNGITKASTVLPEV